MSARVVLVLISLFSAGFVTGAAAAPSLIVNGSFEAPSVSASPGGGDYQLLSTGQTLGGWKVVGAAGSVSLIGGEFSVYEVDFPALTG